MGSDSFTYDANGNRTKNVQVTQITRSVGGSSYTLSYDAENRTKNMQVTRLVSVSGAATASFMYGGDGNRTKNVQVTRVRSTVGGVTMIYIGNPSQGSGQVYLEWKTTTSDMKKYYYTDDTRVAIRMGSSTLNYLLDDHIGSTAITTSSSGSKSAEIRYYPWGTERYSYQKTPMIPRSARDRLRQHGDCDQ